MLLEIETKINRLIQRAPTEERKYLDVLATFWLLDENEKLHHQDFGINPNRKYFGKRMRELNHGG